MAFIKWRDSYNTGVAQFDHEHHQLVELIDKMYVAIRDKSDKEVATQICNELVTYAAQHFGNEEQAMALGSYPELEEHKAEHTLMKQKADSFQARIDNNFPDGATELYHFLRDWLTSHIQNCDKKYGPYLKDREEAE